jgi:tetratricopeptide (TPR) repeat protein
MVFRNYNTQNIKAMKNLFFSTIILCSVSFSTLIFTECSKSNGNTTQNRDAENLGIPDFIDRTSTLGTDEEREKMLTTYDNAIIALKNNAQDYKQYLNIAMIFINESRITGNGGYYNTGAIKMLDKVINAHQQNTDLEFEALSLKSTVLLSMHQFKDAYDIAQKALAMNSKNAGIYGAMVDANVELGHYTAAVSMCDSMMRIKPDLRSYSRVSYLRQITGDNQGAADAMLMAVQAGFPGAENTSWALYQMGDLYLGMGNLDFAEKSYETALKERPNYAYAEIGLAKVEKAKKNYDEAIKHTENAIRIMSESAFVMQLGDLYLLKGDTKKADDVYGDVVDLLEKAEKDQNKEGALLKHNGSRELAIAYMKNGELDKAIAKAEIDYAMRPDNIDANELMAWLYFLKGDNTQAKTYADKMLSTHVQNANTLYKAGVIYSKAGDAAQGQKYMDEAKQISPYIDEIIIKQAQSVQS